MFHVDSGDPFSVFKSEDFKRPKHRRFTANTKLYYTRVLNMVLLVKGCTSQSLKLSMAHCPVSEDLILLCRS